MTLNNLIKLSLILALLFIGPRANEQAHAAPQATYAWMQSTFGPGGSGSVGIYALSSSIGQPAAGEVSAGSYTLGGGFWGGGVVVTAQGTYSVFLPLMLR